jgi:hypothetical protein
MASAISSGRTIRGIMAREMDISLRLGEKPAVQGIDKTGGDRVHPHVRRQHSGQIARQDVQARLR